LHDIYHHDIKRTKPLNSTIIIHKQEQEEETHTSYLSKTKKFNPKSS